MKQFEFTYYVVRKFQNGIWSRHIICVVAPDADVYEFTAKDNSWIRVAISLPELKSTPSRYAVEKMDRLSQVIVFPSEEEIKCIHQCLKRTLEEINEQKKDFQEIL